MRSAPDACRNLPICIELNRTAFELRRAGRVVRLERIPVLFLLVERRGQLVTRQDILDRVWGRYVFVDADKAIDTAEHSMFMTELHIEPACDDLKASPRFSDLLRRVDQHAPAF